VNHACRTFGPNLLHLPLRHSAVHTAVDPVVLLIILLVILL
jgi:hypothetical protein